MKEKYKKLLSSVLATGVILTASGCSHNNNNTQNNQTGCNTVTPTYSSKYYTVQRGDTLTGISKAVYGTAAYWDEIVYYNNITNPDVIKEGQQLLLPTIYEMYHYEIRKGDTLSELCYKRYGTSNKDLVYLVAYYNGISNPDVIQLGQTVVFPEIDTLNLYLEASQFNKQPTLK